MNNACWKLSRVTSNSKISENERQRRRLRRRSRRSRLRRRGHITESLFEGVLVRDSVNTRVRHSIITTRGREWERSEILQTRTA